MEVIDPGHEYDLRVLDDPIFTAQVILRFVKREGPGYPGNTGHYPGTTTQEVLRALIDRTKYVDNQIHSVHNVRVLFHLRMAMWQLEQRAASRHGRVLPDFDLDQIEFQPTCPKCNHIGCPGTCH